MAVVIIFDEATNYILEKLPSANTPEYVGRTDALVNPDLSLLDGIDMIHWKHSSGSVVEMDQTEKSTRDSEIIESDKASVRGNATDFIDNFGDVEVVVRALAEVTRSEINLVRSWTRDYATEVASATSLLNLQLRVSAMPVLNDRTLGQLKASMKSRISDGTAD